MVMKPQFESNPDQIGSKVFTGSMQLPIINDEKDRKVIEDKVLELVKSL